MPRIRSKLSVSVSKQTLDVIEDMLRKKLAKNTSEAVDILANNFLLTQGIGYNTATSTIINEIQLNKNAIIRDIEAALDELIAAKVNECVANMQMKNNPVEPKIHLSDLLKECRATTLIEIEAWAKANCHLVHAAGITVDDFVATKVLMVENSQTKKAAPKGVYPLQTAQESEEEKWKRILAEGMIQYWRAYLNNESLILSSKVFSVARAAVGVRKVIEKMDNGNKDRYLLEIVDRLRRDATDRRWDVDAYMKEFKTIYDGAENIVRNQGR